MILERGGAERGAGVGPEVWGKAGVGPEWGGRGGGGGRLLPALEVLDGGDQILVDSGGGGENVSQPS